jgi:hypothetical protein
MRWGNFIHGIFKCCHKYFEQLYTIHGYTNSDNISLVFEQNIINVSFVYLQKQLLIIHVWVPCMYAYPTALNRNISKYNQIM